MNTDLAQRRDSLAQWKSIGARNPKVWRSILHGDSECFLCSTIDFWPIRRFKKQKPVKEVEPFTCYWSKFKGYSVKVPSVLLLYVQTFRTESGCVSLSVSRKLSSSKQWPQKQVRILISSKMHQCCLIELTGLGLYHNFFQQSMLQLHRIPPTF